MSKISIFAAPFRSLHAVYGGREEHHRNLVDFARDTARELWFFPDKRALERRFYKLRLGIGLIVQTIFWASIAANTYEASRDIVSFGENTMFLLGVTLIYLKVLAFISNWDKIDSIVTSLNKLYLKQTSCQDPDILMLQRSFFLKEGLACTFFHVLAFVLFFTLSVQPIFTEQSIPLPALFPFNLQSADLHPVGIKFVYIFQVFAIFYALLTVLSADTAGVDCIIQITVNLRILTLQLRSMGKQKSIKDFDRNLHELVTTHQTIIDLVDQINDAFYANYLLQMGLSTFMLGLASFEAVLAKDDLVIAFKFLLFMASATAQLFYWCFVGNLAYFDSMEVTYAAYDVHEWFAQSPALQRNLMMMIMRAQEPLMFRAKPFFPFTIETFTKIAKTSYTSFTLLCNTFE